MVPKSRLFEAIDNLRNTKHSFTRHFRHLNPKKFGKQANRLRVFETSAKDIRSKTLSHLKGILDPLTAEQKEIVSRLIVTEDLLKGIKNGIDKPVDGKYPFGFTSEQEVAEAVNELKKLADSEPQAKEAYRVRDDFMKDLYSALADNGIIEDKTEGYQAYFHRRVLEYIDTEKSMATGGKRVGKSKKGFTRKRKGSGGKDYSTNFVESEFKVVADALHELNKVEALNDLMSDYEPRYSKLKEKGNEVFKEKLEETENEFGKNSPEAKAMKKTKGVFNQAYVMRNAPEGYVLWQPNEGNNMFRQQSVTVDAIEQAIPELSLADFKNAGEVTADPAPGHRRPSREAPLAPAHPGCPTDARPCRR
jgi:hypothetical protein